MADSLVFYIGTKFPIVRHAVESPNKVRHAVIYETTCPFLKIDDFVFHGMTGNAGEEIGFFVFLGFSFCRKFNCESLISFSFILLFVYTLKLIFNFHDKFIYCTYLFIFPFLYKGPALF